MMRIKVLIAAAAIGVGFAFTPAGAAPVGNAGAQADAAKALSPLAEVRHRKKVRRFHEPRRSHQKRRRGVRIHDGFYDPYYAPRPRYYSKRRHYRVARPVWFYDDPYYYGGYGYWPHPQAGAWIYPYD